MGKKATKAADNIYCQARYDACMDNTDFESREGASLLLGIDRTRLARIELGKVAPYPEEILSMSKAYNQPELCNLYCANECPIGKLTVKEVVIDDFDRLALKLLGSIKDIDDIRTSLISISEDGEIDEDEWDEFDSIIDSLDKISANATALKLWAQKKWNRQHTHDS